MKTFNVFEQLPPKEVKKDEWEAHFAFLGTIYACTAVDALYAAQHKWPRKHLAIGE